MGRAALFLLFAALAVAASRPASPSWRRSRAAWLLLFATLVSLGVGLTGRDAWPFSSWPMDNVLMPRRFSYLVPVSVDAAGHESEVDPRAFEPLSWVDLTTWIAAQRTVDTALAAQIGPYLLTTVRAARRRAAAGEDVGTYRRRLGPLAAPNTVLSPVRWNRRSPPPDTIAALRIYEVPVDLDGRIPSSAPLSRHLVFAWPQ